MPDHDDLISNLSQVNSTTSAQAISKLNSEIAQVMEATFSNELASGKSGEQIYHDVYSVLGAIFKAIPSAVREHFKGTLSHYYARNANLICDEMITDAKTFRVEVGFFIKSLHKLLNLSKHINCQATTHQHFAQFTQKILPYIKTCDEDLQAQFMKLLDECHQNVADATTKDILQSTLSELAIRTNKIRTKRSAESMFGDSKRPAIAATPVDTTPSVAAPIVAATQTENATPSQEPVIEAQAAQIQQLQLQLAELQAAKQQADTVIAELKATQQHNEALLSQTIAENTKTYQACAAQVDQLRIDLQRAQTQVSELEQQRTALEAQIRSNDGDYMLQRGALNEELTQKTEQLATASDHVNILASQLELSRQTMSTVSNENCMLLMRCAQLETNYDELHNLNQLQAAHFNHNMGLAQTTIATLQAQCQALSQQCAAVQVSRSANEIEAAAALASLRPRI